MGQKNEKAKNSIQGYKKDKTKSVKRTAPKWTIWEIGMLLLVFATLLALGIFVTVFHDNLMHSDTTAEVILSKLLADENKLITRDWYYSTEIRIVYSQLIMMPLFKIFSSYKLVKIISIFIFYILLIWAYFMLVKRMKLSRVWNLLGLALLFAPLSNEYLDMMFIGCFYASQTICMYLVLSYVLKDKKTDKQFYIRVGVLSACGFILGLSGLRYLAALYLPLLLASMAVLVLDKEENEKESIVFLIWQIIMTFFAGVGFLVNKFYLAKHYSFDTTSEIRFVPLKEVPDRFLQAFKLMLEFTGYKEIKAVTPLGMVNPLKCLFLIALFGIVIYLFKHRKEILTKKQRFYLYYFVFLFLINFYLIVFTEVVLHYRYWLPVYVMVVPLIGVFLQKWNGFTKYQKPLVAALLVFVVLGSLYGELWQDMKYNDCEKRYGYMDFIEKEGYTFGYASFWNASVTEYLSNGKIHMGSLGGQDWSKDPYEWLVPKAYYRKGFHEGKTIVILARTEEAGLLKGDFSIMPNAKRVYEDTYYAVYEGDGMYLFSSDD